MSRVLLCLCVLLSLLFLAVKVEAKNQCGGKRELPAKVGSSCDPGPAHCDTGFLVCHGLEALMCKPSCNDVEEEEETPEVKDCDHEELLAYCKQTHCGENGVCSDTLQRCVCFPGFSGRDCSVENLCETTNCGAHGVCSNENGECICDDGYSGNACEMRTKCQPGGVWLNNRCSCKKGFTGSVCDKCEEDALCMPTKDERYPFVLLHVSGDLREEMLSNDPPPGYEYGPIAPGSTYENAEYDCECNKVDGEKQGKMRENFVYYDDYYYQPHQPTTPKCSYVQDYCGHYPRGGYYGNGYYGWGLSLFIFFFFFMFFGSIIFCMPYGNAAGVGVPAASTSASASASSDGAYASTSHTSSTIGSRLRSRIRPIRQPQHQRGYMVSGDGIV